MSYLYTNLYTIPMQKCIYIFYQKNYTLETAGHEMACLKHAISLSFKIVYIKDNKPIFKK